jgi:hypothetical protein
MLGCARDPETIMRNSPLMTLNFLALGLALSLTATACGDDGEMETMATGETTENGDGDGDSGDGDGDGDTMGDGDGDTSSECFNQPPICDRFIRCIGALVPSQLATVEEQFGPMGSCWCGATEDEAQACYETCVEQIDNALATEPTEQACHEEVCGIEELDPDQPYGPIENGACAPYLSEQGEPIEQTPFMGPLGLPGGFCAPACSGLANYCPESSQTSAQGTCYLQAGGELYCVSYCYVDSEVVGGHQCQCGATCQPYGGPDGEGNMRGICTFE